MWIIEVIPVSRSYFREETLTYFSTKTAGVGDMVEITLKGKNLPALVVSSEKLEAKRASIRKGGFTLKKINRIISGAFISPGFIAALGELAEYFIASRSLLLRFFLPQTITGKNILGGSSIFSSSKTSPGRFETSFYQAERSERIKYYKGVIREALSRGRSVFVLLPTVSFAEDAFNDLRNGIEERSFIFHPELKSKELAKSCGALIKSEVPALAVGTASILAFLRADTGILIVDEESHENYYNLMRRPFFDLRRAAEITAQKTGIRLIFGDIMPRLDFKPRYSSLSSGGRLLSSAENTIIDASRTRGEEFKAVSPQMIELMTKALSRKESFVLVGHRRGFAPTTLCRDCGQTVICSRCSSPLVLHQKTPQSRIFFCHYCLKKEEVLERCPNCKSWRLANFGAGVEKIGEELKNAFPDTKLFRFDTDSIKSRKEAENIKHEFIERPGGIMVATEIFLNFFRDPVNHIGVLSVDGMFSIPDYRMHERVMNFLVKLRALAQKSFVVQTRLPDHAIFSYAIGGNLTGFKNEELEERRKLRYPPAADLVKITLEDSDRAKLQSKVAELAEKFKNAEESGNPDRIDFPAFIMRVRGRFRWHILLRFEPGSWPGKHPKIAEILKTLPPSWAIQVDPPSLL